MVLFPYTLVTLVLIRRLLYTVFRRRFSSRVYHRAQDVMAFVDRKSELCARDRVAHELLVHPGLNGPLTLKRFKALLRYRPLCRDLSGLSYYIREAVEMLIVVKILERVRDEESEAEALLLRRSFSFDVLPPSGDVVIRDAPEPKRRRCTMVQKRTWAEIMACGHITAAVLQRLLLSAAHFE